jgi:Xaa-Pro aminopeptidase
MAQTRGRAGGNGADLPFTLGEYRDRLAGVRRLMQERSVDVLLLTGPENIYYLSGYQTTGYYIYQALVVPADGEPQFVVRKFEMTNVQGLSWLKSGFGVEDTEDPLDVTVRAVRAAAGAGPRIGYEDRGFFLPPAILDGLRARLPQGRFVPASGIVEARRLVKSAAEIGYIRAAAVAAGAGLKAGLAAIRPGRTENHVAGAIYAGMLGAGSEYPSSQPYVVTGPRAALGHASYAGHRIRAGHLVYIETGGCVKRYGGAIMRMVAVGKPSAEVKRTAAVMIEALGAIIGAIRPGVTSGSVDEAGRSVVERAGLGKHWLHRTGYSIGVGFPPGWGEGHIFDLKPNDERRLEAGMTFHLVPLLLIPGTGAMGFSETVLVTKTGCEVLTRIPRRLVVR